MWTRTLTSEDSPRAFGWSADIQDGKHVWKMKLQDPSDPYYKIPRTVVGGCSCKTKCVKCSCKRGQTAIERSGICCPITCRQCKCLGDDGRNIDVGYDEEDIDEPSEEEQSSSGDEGGFDFIPYDPYAAIDFSSGDDEL